MTASPIPPATPATHARHAPLWRRPTIAATRAGTAAAGLLGAGAMALCASGECVIPAMDARALNTLNALQLPWLTAFFSAVTWLGSVLVLLPAALVLCAWQYCRGGKALAVLIAEAIHLWRRYQLL